jgi:hypothetical protein
MIRVLLNRTKFCFYVRRNHSMGLFHLPCPKSWAILASILSFSLDPGLKHGTFMQLNLKLEAKT